MTAKLTKNLLKLMDINTENDDATVHPAQFCGKCYRALGRVEECGSKTSLVVTIWTQHND